MNNRRVSPAVLALLMSLPGAAGTHGPDGPLLVDPRGLDKYRHTDRKGLTPQDEEAIQRAAAKRARKAAKRSK